MTDPFAPPESAVAPESSVAPGLGDDVEYAGFGVRLGARIVDQLLHTLIGAGAGCVVAPIAAGLVAASAIPPGWEDRAQGLSFAGVVCGLVSSTAFHAISESFHGATLGKLLFGLRVVSADGGRASMGQGIGRSLAYLVDSLFFGLVAYSAMSSDPQQRRVGDRWAGTVVVRAASEPEPTRRSLTVFGVALLTASAVSVVTNALGLVIKIW